MQFDFFKPQRESPVVIILILFKSLYSLVRQFFLPFITIYLVGRKDNENPFFTYFIVIVTVISLMRSLISFFRKKYYIDEDQLVVRSGALSNKTITIPFERIQSINFEQNLIHRFFNVVKLKIDTAGSSQKEAELDGLQFAKAEALRLLLLKEKDEALSKINITEETLDTKIDEVPAIEASKTILTLSIKDLMKASLFENHFNSLALIFAGIWYIYINAKEIGVDAEDYVDDIPIMWNVTVYGALLLLTLFITVLISVIRTVISYYNLSFVRLQNGFRIKKGLFNYVTLSAIDHKIQTLGWSDTWLKRKIGIHDIHMKQASIKQVNTKESIIIPGANLSHVNEVIKMLYPQNSMDKINMYQVNTSYLDRKIFFSLLFSFLFSLIAIYFKEGILLITFIVGMFLLPYYFTKKFRKLKYGYDNEFLRLSGGVFADSHVLMPIYKVQSVEKHQSPYQRKRGIVSLSIHNASGTERIPYIKEEEAHRLMNFFLYKAEIDDRAWI
jgi:putative membrane protein